ncbi:MAG: tetratricopeptide repeat protein, partial [Planctomycetota bacterium]
MNPIIFISSVSRELRTYRRKAKDTLYELGYDTIVQEHISTSPKEIRQLIRAEIDKCSAVIQIVGDAYGLEPPLPDKKFQRVSYTQYEAKYAESQGKPVYYLIAEETLERDECPSSIDAPRNNTVEEQANSIEKQRLQKMYRENVTESEHVFYPIIGVEDLENKIRRLDQKLDRLRGRFKRQMLVILGLLSIITCGLIFVVLKADSLSDDVKIILEDRVTATEQELADIQIAYDLAIEAAKKKRTGKEREIARELAEQIRTRRIEELDESIDRNRQLVSSGQANNEFLEMVRIKAEEGAEKATEYVINVKHRLYARHEIDQSGNKNLEAILETLVRQQSRLGNYQSAMLECEELLQSAPGWPAALHEKCKLLIVDGDVDIAYGHIKTATAKFQLAVEVADQIAQSVPLHPSALRDQALSRDKLGVALLKRGKVTEALKMHKEALTIKQQGISSFATNRFSDLDICISHKHLGIALQSKGDSQAALGQLKKAKSTLEKLVDEKLGDSRLQFELANVLDLVGDWYLTSEELQMAATEYSAAKKLRQNIVKANPSDLGAKRHYSASLVSEGCVELKMEEPEDALRKFEQAVIIRRELVENDETLPTRRRDLAVALSNKAKALLALGQSDKAFPIYSEALSIREKLARTDPTDFEIKRDLAISYDNVGKVLWSRDRSKNSIVYFESAMELREEIAAMTNDVDALKELAVSHSQIGDRYLDARNISKAKIHIQRKCEVLQEALNRDPENVEFSRDFATSQFEIGKLILMSNGKFSDIVARFNIGIDRLEKISKRSPANNGISLDLLAAHQFFGNVYSDAKKHELALGAYQRMANIYDSLEAQNLKSDRVSLAGLVVHQSLATCLRSLGKTEDSVVHCRKMLEIGKKMAEADPSNGEKQLRLASVYRQIAKNLTGSVQGDEIRSYYQQALEIRKKQLFKTPEDIQVQSWVADSQRDVGDFFWRNGEPEKGLIYLEDALSISNTIARQNPNDAQLAQDLVLAHR